MISYLFFLFRYLSSLEWLVIDDFSFLSSPLGKLLSNKQYSRLQFLAVTVITTGVILFSAFERKSTHVSSGAVGRVTDGSLAASVQIAVGLLLVVINLFMDGFTNAQEEKVS